MVIPLTISVQFSSVAQSVGLFATPWTTAPQSSLSITNSQSLLKLISIELVMPSNHLILCRPLLLPSSIFPSIRVFPNDSALHIRLPKYWSFSFSLWETPLHIHERLCMKTFPGGTVDRSFLPMKGTQVPIPGPGRAHRPRSSSTWVPQPLSLCSGVWESQPLMPEHPGDCALWQEDHCSQKPLEHNWGADPTLYN